MESPIYVQPVSPEEVFSAENAAAAEAVKKQLVMDLARAVTEMKSAIVRGDEATAASAEREVAILSTRLKDHFGVAPEEQVIE